MSVNKEKPHVYVIREDRRDAQIANGFARHVRKQRQIQVMPEAGGWSEVLSTFKQEYIRLLRQNGDTNVVMLIDFDGTPEERRARFDSEIPEDVRPRVFLIGPLRRPEDLRQSIGKGYEDIGRSLAEECDNGSLNAWVHEHLRHNDQERLRLVEAVKPFLFAD